MARKPISVSVLAGAACSVLLIACGGASTEEGGVTGLHVALAVPHDAKAEVSGVHFEVTNNLGEARHAIFSLEEETLPGLLGPDLAGQPFTDWLVRLEPGDYIVAATPLKKGGSPSDLFAQARGGASVFAGMTTALVLTGRTNRPAQTSLLEPKSLQIFGQARESKHGRHERRNPYGEVPVD